jgi:probable phosphoglycerate mutase
VVDDTEHSDQRVVLVRHAQTAWTVTGQHTGTTDLPLTDDGRVATHRLAERLAGRRFTRVLTSPLQRAAETCRIAGFAQVAEIRADLVEWDYGAYEGRTTADIRTDDPGWDLWQHGAPGGESPAAVARRVAAVIDELVDTCAHGGDILVFAHGHSLTALAVRWLGLPISHGRLFRLDTGSLSTLGWKRGLRVLETWNDRGHLSFSSTTALTAPADP